MFKQSLRGGYYDKADSYNIDGLHAGGYSTGLRRGSRHGEIGSL